MAKINSKKQWQKSIAKSNGKNQWQWQWQKSMAMAMAKINSNISIRFINFQFSKKNVTKT